MIYLTENFIKRIPREGWKSLSVSALALVLVYLINMLGGIRAQMEEDYNYVMDHHPVYFELSDGDGAATDGLMIPEDNLAQFTQPDSLWSLYDYVGDLLFKRELDVVGEQAPQLDIELIGVSDPWSVYHFSNDSILATEILYSNNYAAKGNLEWEQIGIDPNADFNSGIRIELVQGYSRDLNEFYMQYGAACLVTEDLLGFVRNGILKLNIKYMQGSSERVRTYNLNIAGVVKGPVSGKVFCDFNMTNSIAPATGHMAFYVINMPEGNGISVRPPIKTAIARNPPVVGSLAGITIPEGHDAYLPANIVNAEFVDGYDKHIFITEEYVCVVSGDAAHWVRDGAVTVSAKSKADEGAKVVDVELRVVGTAPGDGNNVIYIPFETANKIGKLSDGQQFYSERLRGTVSDNRYLADFKQTARRTFFDVGVYFNYKVSSMTIFDEEFYDLTETLQQTIFFIDIVTPFVYFIAVCVGFVASFLLTRRRASEFAVMRSIGVYKGSIFVVTLLEQTLLCAAGVLISCAVYALTWDSVLSLLRPAVFLACYVSGSVLSAARAARTDVLTLLRDRE